MQNNRYVIACVIIQLENTTVIHYKQDLDAAGLYSRDMMRSHTIQKNLRTYTQINVVKQSMYVHRGTHSISFGYLQNILSFCGPIMISSSSLSSTSNIPIYIYTNVDMQPRTLEDKIIFSLRVPMHTSLSLGPYPTSTQYPPTCVLHQINFKQKLYLQRYSFRKVYMYNRI